MSKKNEPKNSSVEEKIIMMNAIDSSKNKSLVAIQGDNGDINYVSYDDKTGKYNIERRTGGSANLRTNNPGNIIATTGSEKWEGVIGTRVDPAGRKFLVFDSMEHGQNAARNLLNTPQYTNAPAVSGLGLEQGSIGAAIYKWAPPNENDTSSYIANVERITGMDRNTKLSDLSPSEKEKVLSAIYNQEGNQQFAVGTEFFNNNLDSWKGVDLKNGNISDFKKLADNVKKEKIEKAKKLKELSSQYSTANEDEKKAAEDIKNFFLSDNFSPNILDSYDNPNYRIRIWVLLGSELEKMNITNFMNPSDFEDKEKFVVYDSIVNTNFGIDNLEINSKVGANPQTKKVFVTDFSFDLIEPNGCLFFDRLKILIGKIGYIDHKQTIFFLEVSFIGKSNEESNKSYNIPNIRIIPFIFSEVKTKISSSGSIHKIKCHSAVYGIATSVEYFNFTKKIEITNIVSFKQSVKKIIKELNKCAEENILEDVAKSGRLPDACVYDVDFSALNYYNGPVKKNWVQRDPDNPQLGDTEQDIDISETIKQNSGESTIFSGTMYTIHPGDSIEKVLDDFSSALNDNIKLSVSDKDIVRDSSSNPCFFRWEPIIKYCGQLVHTKQKIFKVTYAIRRYYDPALILSLPSNIEKQTSATYEFIKEVGSPIEKKYEYIFTSKNNNILELDINLDMLWWVSTYENIASRPSDNSATAVDSNKIADDVRKYMENKVYNIAPSMTNIGSSAPKVEFVENEFKDLVIVDKNLFSKEKGEGMGAIGASASDVYKTTYLDLCVRTPINFREEEYNLYDPTVLKGDVIYRKSGMPPDAVNRNDVKAMSSFDQLYAAGNMIWLNMTIRGDPYWLCSNAVYDYNTSASFVFEMKTPTNIENIEYDNINSCLTAKTLFGLYEVIEIKHKFSRGLFTQQLKAKVNLNLRFPM